jgi:ribose transport system substrate-binding protein
MIALASLALVACGGSSSSSSSSTASSDSGEAGQEASGSKEDFSDLGSVSFDTTMTSPVFVKQAKSLQSYGNQLGIEVSLYDNRSSATKAVENAQQVVAQNPGVAMDAPPIADATARLTSTYERAGIPCISVSLPIEGCPLFNFNQKSLAAQQADFFAEQMKKRGWDGSNTMVVIGSDAELGPSVNIATSWFYQELSKQVPGMEPVTAEEIEGQTTTITPDQGLQVNTGYEVESSYEAFSAALQSIPSDRHLVVYTISDDATVGVRRALQNAHRTDAMIAGYGGDEDALKAIRTDPVWVSDAQGFYEDWGEFLLAEAVALKRGEEVPAETYPPELVITKENIEKYYPGGATQPKLLPELPASSKYLEKTGVLQAIGNVEGLN